LLLAVDSPVDTEAMPVEADELRLVTLLPVVLKPVDTEVDTEYNWLPLITSVELEVTEPDASPVIVLLDNVMLLPILMPPNAEMVNGPPFITMKPAVCVTYISFIVDELFPAHRPVAGPLLQPGSLGEDVPACPFHVYSNPVVGPPQA
jgi:hypothetical protein